MAKVHMRDASSQGGDEPHSNEGAPLGKKEIGTILSSLDAINARVGRLQNEINDHSGSENQANHPAFGYLETAREQARSLGTALRDTPNEVNRGEVREQMGQITTALGDAADEMKTSVPGGEQKESEFWGGLIPYLGNIQQALNTSKQEAHSQERDQPLKSRLRTFVEKGLGDIQEHLPGLRENIRGTMAQPEMDKFLEWFQEIDKGLEGFQQSAGHQARMIEEGAGRQELLQQTQGMQEGMHHLLDLSIFPGIDRDIQEKADMIARSYQRIESALMRNKVVS